MSNVQKKLQVFISSTFTDLRDERQAAVEATLLAKHIPAGMELFSAGDASQWQVIQEWISASDVYLLILGARYGSIEPNSGRSYTELEYEFAVESGMPYFAVVLDDAAVAEKRQAELVSHDDEMHGEKMAAFRSKVLSRSSKMVKDSSAIQLAILQSLHEIERRPSLVGWVRSDTVVDTATLMGRLSALTVLQHENESLRARVTELEQAKTEPQIAALDEEFAFTIQSKREGFTTRNVTEYKRTWRQLFSLMAMKLLASQNDEYFNRTIAREVSGSTDPNMRFVIAESDWETIRAQFLALGFVSIQHLQTMSNAMALFWSLTELGKQVGIALKAQQPAA